MTPVATPVTTIIGYLLIREVERYLAAVELFRSLGHEPRWQK